MIRKSLMLTSCLLASLALHAQHRVKVSEFSVGVGTFNQETPVNQLNDWRLMAPGSQLVPQLSKEVNLYNAYNNSMTGGSMWTANVGLQFSDKAGMRTKRNPLLRLGIQYQNATVMSRSFHKVDTYAYDTLTSSQTGEQFYVDSFHAQHYNLDYRQKRLMLDASLIFRTKTDSRWSVYGGVGLAIGFTFNNQTQIDYHTYDGVNGFSMWNYTRYSHMSSNGNDHRNEIFANNSSFAGSIYLPMGVNFRLSKRHEFWRMTSLFLETRPGLYWYGLPELKTSNMNTGVATQFGLRVHW